MPTHSVPPPGASQDAYKEDKISAIRTWQLRCLVVITLVGCVALLGVIFWLLSSIADALILFLLSMLLAYVIYPLVRILQRILPLPLAIFIVYIGILGILLIFLYVVGFTALGQLVNLIGNVQQEIPKLVDRLQVLLTSQRILNISLTQLQGASQQIVSYLLGLAANVQPFIVSLFSAFISVILMTTLSIYFVIYGPRFNAWLNTATPRRHRRTIAFFLHTLDRTVGGFIRGQLLLGTLMSTIIGVGLFFLGVPYAVLLAAIVFIFEFIPQIGVYISGTIIVLTALITRGWQIGLAVLVFSSFVQGVLDGQILAPRIIGHSVGLNPIISIFALLVGTKIFGLLGAFFSAPLAGVIQAFIIVGYQTWKQEHPEEFISQDEADQSLPGTSMEKALRHADQHDDDLHKTSPDTPT
jgi:Predicted permease